MVPLDRPVVSIDFGRDPSIPAPAKRVPPISLAPLSPPLPPSPSADLSDRVIIEERKESKEEARGEVATASAFARIMRVREEEGVSAAPKAMIEYATLAPLVHTELGTRRYQIKVLNQLDLLPGGISHCGYHALKNVLLAILFAGGNVKKETFIDNRFFIKFREFVFSFKSEGEKSDITTGEAEDDVSIVSLTDALIALEAGNVPKDLVELQPLTEFCKIYPHHVSIFSYVGGCLSIVIDDNLVSIANLAEVSRKAGPFTHGFVIGGMRHWISLIMEKDAAGKVTWYGCDSWNNQTIEFTTHINMLERILANPDEVIQFNYNYTVGTGLAKQASLFDEKGVLKDSASKKSLLSDHMINKYLKRMQIASAFMKRVGWITSINPIIQKLVADLRTLLRFYISNIEKNEPYLEIAENLRAAP